MWRTNKIIKKTPEVFIDFNYLLLFYPRIALRLNVLLPQVVLESRLVSHSPSLLLCSRIALVWVDYRGAKDFPRQSRRASQKQWSKRKQNWISSTQLLSKQTKLMDPLLLLPSNYCDPVERIWQNQLTQNSNTLNPFYTHKPHIHQHYFITKPPRQTECWNGPTSCKNPPPLEFNQLMRDMQMKSLWDYGLSNSSPPHRDTVLM